MEQTITAEDLEKLRIKIHKKERIILIVSIICIPLYFVLFFYSDIGKTKDGIVMEIIVSLVATVALAIGTFALLWFMFINSSYKKFNILFKLKYVTQTIENVYGFSNLQYSPFLGFKWEDIRNAAVVNCGIQKYFESEDMLDGTYDGINFKISDVTTQKIVRKNKGTKVEEIFSGQILCLFDFDDNKVSDGHLQIFQKEFLSDIIGWKADCKIHTENEEFNSKFKIYSTDEHNAYYILTPQRIEKIMEFANSVGVQTALTFTGNKMFVAIKRHNMFDAAYDIPIEKQTEDILKDAEIIQMAKNILIL